MKKKKVCEKTSKEKINFIQIILCFFNQIVKIKSLFLKIYFRISCDLRCSLQTKITTLMCAFYKAALNSWDKLTDYAGSTTLHSQSYLCSVATASLVLI